MPFLDYRCIQDENLILNLETYTCNNNIYTLFKARTVDGINGVGYN